MKKRDYCSTSPPAVTRLTVYRGPYMWSGGVFEALFLEISLISDDILFIQVVKMYIKNVLVKNIRDIKGGSLRMEGEVSRKNVKKMIWFIVILFLFLMIYTLKEGTLCLNEGIT